MPRNDAKRDTPREFRAVGGAASVKASEGAGADGKAKLPTFSMVAYTGAPMQPEGWFSPIIVDLAGVRVPSQHRPILRQHDPAKIVGHSTAVRVTDAAIEIDGVMSGVGPDRDEVVGLAGNGFQWQASIGANPIRTEWLEAGETATVNGRDVTGPMTISRETELGESSFVPLGADGATSATVSASKRRGSMFEKSWLKLARSQGVKGAKFSDEDIDKMTEDEAKAAFKKCMAEGDGAEEEKEKAAEDAKAKAAAEDEKDEEKKAEAARKARVQATRKAEADEMRRVSEIKARCAKYAGVNRVKLDNGQDVDLIPHAIEAGWSANDAELHALRHSRPGPGVGSGPHLHFGSGAPQLAAMNGDEAAAVLECAVFQANRSFELLEDSFYTRKTNDRDPIPARDAARIKAELKRRYTEKVQDDAHRMFRGRIGLGQMLTLIARGGGYAGRDTISDDNLSEVAAACMRINADGGSTISIGNVTSNVQNKFLLQGYLFTEQAWRDICAFRSVKDFKATKSINLFGDTEFKDLGASGELENATLSDQAFANQVATSGRILTIPRTTLINDDIGALGQVPMVMGRGAGLKLNRVFWTKYLAPGNDDGGSTAFYAAVHTIANQLGNSNLSSGAGSALSSAGLTAAVLLADKQVDPKGNPLGVDMELLVYPPELETAAWELMNSQFIIQSAGATTKQPSENRWKGRFKAVKSRYLSNAAYTGYSAAAWYLQANPSILPVIEMAFLNGQETPTVQTAGPDFQFNVMGITTRAFFDIGCNVQNFRGGVKSAGS